MGGRRSNLTSFLQKGQVATNSLRPLYNHRCPHLGQTNSLILSSLLLGELGKLPDFLEVATGGTGHIVGRPPLVEPAVSTPATGHDLHSFYLFVLHINSYPRGMV